MPSKTFTLKTIEVYTVYGALTQTEKANTSLPFKLAWEIADIKEALKIHVERYDASRLEIYGKFGKPTEVRGEYSFDNAVIPDLEAAIKELNDVEIVVVFEPIAVAKIEAVKDIQFASGAFEVLRKQVIEFPVKPKPAAKADE